MPMAATPDMNLIEKKDAAIPHIEHHHNGISVSVGDEIENEDESDDVYTTCSESESHDHDGNNAFSSLLATDPSNEEECQSRTSSLPPTFLNEPITPRFTDCSEFDDRAAIQSSKETWSQQPESWSPLPLSSRTGSPSLVNDRKFPPGDSTSVSSNSSRVEIIHGNSSSLSPPPTPLQSSSLLSSSQPTIPPLFSQSTVDSKSQSKPSLSSPLSQSTSLHSCLPYLDYQQVGSKEEYDHVECSDHYRIRQEMDLKSSRVVTSSCPLSSSTFHHRHNSSNIHENKSQRLDVTQQRVFNSKDSNRKPRHKHSHRQQHQHHQISNHRHSSNIISIYQQYLRKNRLIFKIFEECLSRMVVLYAPFSREDEGGEWHYEQNTAHDISMSRRSQTMTTTKMMNYREIEGGKTGIQPEIWYALLNLWGLLNDSLYYYGNGDDSGSSSSIVSVGNGLTINYDITTSIPSNENVCCKSERNYSEKNDICTSQNEMKATAIATKWMEKNNKASVAIVILRTTLSIVECVAPALEVTTYYSAPSVVRGRQNGRRSGINDYLSSIDRHANALQVVVNMEQIKFLCRVGIITINYWNIWRTQFCAFPTSPTTALQARWKILSMQSRLKSKRGMGAQVKDEDEIEANIALSGVGILQDGGLLRPGEDYINTPNQSSEERRVRKLLYVGKRTGRRIQASTTSQPIMSTVEEKASTVAKVNCHCISETNVNNCPTGELPFSLSTARTKTKSEMMKDWMKTIKIKVMELSLVRQNLLLTTTRRRLVYLLMGELLHLYRPLCWVQACHRHETARGRMIPHLSPPHNLFSSKNRDNRTKYWELMKPWIICFAMDVISHKISGMGTHVSTRDASSNIIRNGGNHFDNNDISTLIDVSSQTTKEELHRRKMRWVLYLLRAPIWSLVTYPLTKASSKLLGFCVPLVGKPLAIYLLELLLYWQKWHFMLES